jgi:biotin-(acetyl-CoA carboxylase) ligase
MTTALAVVAGHLHRAMSRRAEEPFTAVLRQYDSHHALVGRRVTVAGADPGATVTGRCEGLDEMGRLTLRARGTLHRVIAGQVTIGERHSGPLSRYSGKGIG